MAVLECPIIAAASLRARINHGLAAPEEPARAGSSSPERTPVGVLSRAGGRARKIGHDSD
jgi:hypothetical protein